MRREIFPPLFLENEKNMLDTIKEIFNTLFSAYNGTALFRVGCWIWNILIGYAWDMLQTDPRELADQALWNEAYRIFQLMQILGASLVNIFFLINFFKETSDIKHGMEVYVPTPITLLKIADTEIPYSKASKEQQAAYDAGNLEGRKIIHFKVGYTFDIAQTNFPPEHYPKFLDRGIPSELHKQCTEVLKEFCEETLGVRVFLQDQDQEIKGAALYGFHSPGTSEIHIASTLQDTAAFSTLTHEVGHALAHGTLDEFFNIGSHQKEFEADVMSIMLQQHYGLEITDERKSHLVGHYKSWLESDPKNFAPDKSIKKMFDLYSSQVKLLDQKMIQKFPELAQKLLAPEIEPNPEAKLQKQITRKSIPKKKKTLRR